MKDFEKIQYTQNVERYIPANVRVIQVLLYVVVVIFAIIGMAGGLFWGILAVGTLLFAWFFVGVARVTYIYMLEGSRLKVRRMSGFKSRPKTVDFAELELQNLRVLAPEGSHFLDDAEADTRDLQPKRITYDISAHMPGDICAVMFLEGIDKESGRWLKVYFQPSPELMRCIRRIKPEAVRGYAE